MPADAAFHFRLIAACVIIISILTTLFTLLEQKGLLELIVATFHQLSKSSALGARKAYAMARAVVLAVLFGGFFLSGSLAIALAIVNIRDREALYVDVKRFHDKNLNKLLEISKVDFATDENLFHVGLKHYHAHYWVLNDRLYVRKLFEFRDNEEGKFFFKLTSRVGLDVAELASLAFRVEVQEEGMSKWEEVGLGELETKFVNPKKVLVGISKGTRTYRAARVSYDVGGWRREDPLSMVYFDPGIYKEPVDRVCVDVHLPKGTNYEELRAYHREKGEFSEVVGNGSELSRLRGAVYFQKVEAEETGRAFYWEDASGRRRGFWQLQVMSEGAKDPLILTFDQRLDYEYRGTRVPTLEEEDFAACEVAIEGEVGDAG